MELCKILKPPCILIVKLTVVHYNAPRCYLMEIIALALYNHSQLIDVKTISYTS